MESPSTAARSVFLLAHSVPGREMGDGISSRMAVAACDSYGPAASGVACLTALRRRVADRRAEVRGEARRPDWWPDRSSASHALSVLLVQCRILFRCPSGCDCWAPVL